MSTSTSTLKAKVINFDFMAPMEDLLREYNDRKEDEFQVSLTSIELDSLSMVAYYVNNYFCDLEENGAVYSRSFNTFLDGLYDALKKLEAV